MIRGLLVFLLLLQCVPVPAVADIYADEEPKQESTEVPRYEPDQEAVRSLVFPGWSQHRQGASEAGWGFTTIAAVTLVFALGFFEVPVLGNEDDNFGQVLAGALYALNAVVSGFDAYNRAAESNRENGWDLQPQARNADPGIRVGLVRLSF